MTPESLKDSVDVEMEFLQIKFAGPSMISKKTIVEVEEQPSTDLVVVAPVCLYF